MQACCFKTQFGNFKSGWIKAEDAFVAPTRKGETEKTKFSLSSTKEKLSPQRFLAVRNKGSETVPPCFRKLEKN